MPTRYVAIANPDSSAGGYAQNLRAWASAASSRTSRWCRARAVPRTAISMPGRLRSAGGGAGLESPGRDFEVTQLLLQAGARDDEALPRTDGRSLPYRKGELLHPRQLYGGFRRVLHGMHSGLRARPQLRRLACPRDVAVLFDKNATAARLTAAEIPCPPSIAAPGTPAELLDALRQHRFKTAYVKLNTGSSASCIAVVHALDDPPWAITSIVRLDGGFFSTRRLRRSSGEDLTAILQFLLEQDACVQQGIPMAQIDGLNFDVRVVVIDGVAALTVFRLSHHPMTNLHLGGRRGSWAECRAAIPTRAWLDAMDHCVEAARCSTALRWASISSSPPAARGTTSSK